jgi:hypothetical protein
VGGGRTSRGGTWGRQTAVRAGASTPRSSCVGWESKRVQGEQAAVGACTAQLSPPHPHPTDTNRVPPTLLSSSWQ